MTNSRKTNPISPDQANAAPVQRLLAAQMIEVGRLCILVQIYAQFRR
jgi:hypothetical protein